jgi:hypothetical protein
MVTDLHSLFLELHEELQSLKGRKHQQAKAYYHKHFGKDTFRPMYYEELKDEFSTIEKMECFFNLLSENSSLLFVVAECMKNAKDERRKGQPIEYIKLWLPLVPVVENLGNCYFFNLLNLNEKSHE